MQPGAAKRAAEVYRNPGAAEADRPVRQDPKSGLRGACAERYADAPFMIARRARTRRAEGDERWRRDRSRVADSKEWPYWSQAAAPASAPRARHAVRRTARPSPFVAGPNPSSRKRPRRSAPWPATAARSISLRGMSQTKTTCAASSPRPQNPRAASTPAWRTPAAAAAWAPITCRTQTSFFACSISTCSARCSA